MRRFEAWDNRMLRNGIDLEEDIPEHGILRHEDIARVGAKYFVEHARDEINAAIKAGKEPPKHGYTPADAMPIDIPEYEPEPATSDIDEFKDAKPLLPRFMASHEGSQVRGATWSRNWQPPHWRTKPMHTEPHKVTWPRFIKPDREKEKALLLSGQPKPKIKGVLEEMIEEEEYGIQGLPQDD